MKDGTVLTNPGKLNPDIVRPEGVIDPEIPLMAVKQDGMMRLIVANISNHTDTIGGDLVSADSRAWCSGWEGLTSAHDPDMVQWANRIQYAQEYFAYLQTHFADPVTTWIAGNRYLTTAESQNNAILLYRFFAGTVPPTPGPPYVPGRSHMPVWMMLKPY